MPFPPGDYPVVVVGSGPGGIQTSYFLSKLGVAHAAISADDAPGGMFQRFPLFQRLISWTKPYAISDTRSQEYEWYDWNSLIAEEPEHRATVLEFLDDTSVFPRRSEMEAGFRSFVQRTGIVFRYGCRWESTDLEDDKIHVNTTDGTYTCRALVLAVGMTDPWKPSNIEGVDLAIHYSQTRPPETYSSRRVFVIGKGNSGFEIADGLLPYASQMILCSPRPPRISINTYSIAAARARYLQPYEDHILGGGTVLIVDGQPTRISTDGEGFRVDVEGTTIPGPRSFLVDDVIVATGFGAPLRDLASKGLATFYREGLLPAQTPFWESTSLKGVYFAGNITQGSVGLKKYGIPSSSGSVHGFRYNARVLARHMAETRFGVQIPRITLKSSEVVRTLLEAATLSPDLKNQQSYLARVISFDPADEIRDEGIVPLSHFVDSPGPPSAAIAIETDNTGNIHPAVYVRESGGVSEHLLPPDPLFDYTGGEHAAALTAALKPLI